MMKGRKEKKILHTMMFLFSASFHLLLPIIHSLDSKVWKEFFSSFRFHVFVAHQFFMFMCMSLNLSFSLSLFQSLSAYSLDQLHSFVCSIFSLSFFLSLILFLSLRFLSILQNFLPRIEGNEKRIEERCRDE